MGSALLVLRDFFTFERWCKYPWSGFTKKSLLQTTIIVICTQTSSIISLFTNWMHFGTNSAHFLSMIPLLMMVL